VGSVSQVVRHKVSPWLCFLAHIFPRFSFASQMVFHRFSLKQHTRLTSGSAKTRTKGADWIFRMGKIKVTQKNNLNYGFIHIIDIWLMQFFSSLANINIYIKLRNLMHLISTVTTFKNYYKNCKHLLTKKKIKNSHR